MLMVQEAPTGSPRENCVCGWRGKAEVNFLILPYLFRQGLSLNPRMASWLDQQV